VRTALLLHVRVNGGCARKHPCYRPGLSAPQKTRQRSKTGRITKPQQRESQMKYGSDVEQEGGAHLQGGECNASGMP
jgi:hypothetical protein